jgi:putative addiction module component (TIGR02574 family)
MMISSFDIDHFSPEERLELLDRLWDSLSKKPEAIAVTDAQRAELDRRLADMEHDPDAGVSFDEVEQRILKVRR